MRACAHMCVCVTLPRCVGVGDCATECVCVCVTATVCVCDLVLIAVCDILINCFTSM